ncbi:MAG: hypothetical protein V1495_08735 [Pseudomonadota bacterium]
MKTAKRIALLIAIFSLAACAEIKNVTDDPNHLADSNRSPDAAIDADPPGNGLVVTGTETTVEPPLSSPMIDCSWSQPGSTVSIEVLNGERWLFIRNEAAIWIENIGRFDYVGTKPGYFVKVSGCATATGGSKCAPWEKIRNSSSDLIVKFRIPKTIQDGFTLIMTPEDVSNRCFSETVQPYTLTVRTPIGEKPVDPDGP